MAALLWAAWGEEWALEEKVSFNGVTKRITVNAGVTSLDIRAEVYSAWVRWVSRESNTRFLQAMQAVGADPIPGGETGLTFFLINGWKLVYDPNAVAVAGVLYSSDYGTAYWSSSDQPIYPATVSSLVNTAVTYQNVVTGTALTSEQTAEAVWSMALEGLTAEQMMRIMLSALAGKRQGLGTPTEQYLAQDGVTPRITLTADSNGNGTPVLNGAA